eukprot:TRINITY_DN5235_c0_g1_i5.p1 TRINITY_DN5235_c0_g1~~TRINITY_DN5235_c0_g1_i5.p1  ORF type:complete len:317 (-),score=72.51 TRINITY_DN5235_c0_g1_i5:35-985(-)
MVDFLLALPGVSVTAQNNQAIIAAARGGHLAMLHHLLALPGVDVAAQSNEAVIRAAGNGHVAMVEHLLALPGVDVTAKEQHAIIAAAANGHVAMVDRLLPQVDVTRCGPRAVLIAGQQNHDRVKVVDRLLAQPAIDLTSVLIDAVVERNSYIARRVAVLPNVQPPVALQALLLRPWLDTILLYATVETMLSSATAAVALGLQPATLHSPMARYLHAVQLCAPHHKYNIELLYKTFAEVHRVADVMVCHEQLPAGVAELMCEWLMDTAGLAHFALQCQRQIRSCLKRLASVAKLSEEGELLRWVRLDARQFAATCER